MMAMGPDTPALGEVKTAGQLWQNQVAKTVAKFLGHEYEGDRYECGKVVNDMFENEK